jgi:16S rRNA (cytosine967-C5)-methyltransferase
MNARKIVLRIVTYFDNQPGNLDRIIDKELQDTQIDHRDRRFVFEIVYGIFRHRITLDYYIDALLSEETLLTDPHLRRILQLGMYQILYLDKVPNHAAVNESVNIAKSGRDTRQYAGVVNAVLRNLIKTRRTISLPDPQKDHIGRLGIEYSHPRWMIERWVQQFGLARARTLLTFNNEKPPIYLRRKIRGLSRQQFEGDVRFICEQATGYRNLYYRLKKPIAPESLQLIKRGIATVQAPSSGWVIALMDAQKNDRILDVCAAPGGKTSLLSELVGDTGSVYACEIKWGRMQRVLETMYRMDLINVYPLVCDGNCPPFTTTFDKIVLDAPCSATGVFHRHPEARYLRTKDDIDKLATIQRDLLESSASLIKKNGILVYATCSLEAEENEEQIDLFLKNHPEFTIDHLPDSIPDRYMDDRGFLRITPYEHGLDGMFGARLRKS